MPLYDKSTELSLERLLTLMERRAEKGRPLAQADVALGIGVSPAVISHFLKRSYEGDVKKVADAVRAFVEREEAKDADGGLLTIPFVETRQAQTLLRAWKFCATYGRLGAVIGEPGAGKTRTIQEILARDRSVIILEAWCRLGASGVLQELCDHLKVSDRGLLRALMKRIKHKLTDSGRCLIVDDAHTLRFEALDVLRHIYDQTGVGMLLVGIGALKRHLTGRSEETEQLASRVSGRIWELPEINESDVEKILGATMAERERDAAMRLLREDPQTLASPRRMGNLLEVAGVFARKDNGGAITVEHLRKAMRVAA